MRRWDPTAGVSPTSVDRRRWRGRRTALRAVAAGFVAISLSVLAGCSSAHDALGTSNGGCFVTLPAAGVAVHHQGKLLGARLVSVKDLRPRAESLLYQVAGEAKVKRVCLVAFEGSFMTGTVEHPSGESQGRVAIVVIEYPNSRLLGTVVLSKLPNRFGHSHLG